MNGEQVPAATLRILRFALLGGVVLFGVVIAYLTGSGGIEPDPALGRIMGIFFAIEAIVCVGTLAMIRSRWERTDPARRGAATLVGWAIAEGAALIGGVCWLFGGARVFYFTGVALLVAALLLLPASDDA